ncbi:MAG: micrococcal nuclease [Pirellulaceae bacterium]|nr:micrococcal nuclease [Pirellulaceae bacterium]
MRPIQTLIFGIVVIAGCQPASQSAPQQHAEPSQEIRGRVDWIADGDSFHFQCDDGSSLRVRLEGIDCPEHGQPFADQAKRVLQQLTNNRVIWISPTGTDKYGRTLANARDNAVWMNGELVRRGLAWHYSQFNSDPRLARLQRDARVAGVGLWQDDMPLAPWDFRERGR